MYLAVAKPGIIITLLHLPKLYAKYPLFAFGNWKHENVYLWSWQNFKKIVFISIDKIKSSKPVGCGS